MKINVLTPVDVSFIADKAKVMVESFKAKLIAEIKSIMPLGYSLCGDGTWIVVCSTEGVRPEHPILSANVIAYKNNGRISYESKATPNEIYRVSGMLQILAGDDLTILGNFSILN